MENAVTPLARYPLTAPRPALAAPRPFRAFFSGLGMLAPDLAARAAERLFFTPSRHPVPALERLAGAEAVTRWLPTPAGLARTYLWPSGPCLPWENRRRGGRVLLIHGWSGRATQLAGFVEPLRRLGLELLGVDAPAHGSAPGSTFDLERYVEVLRAVEASHGPFAGAIAHSMGGGALAVALTAGFSAHRVVLVGAPSRIRFAVDDFVRRLDLPEPVTRAFEARFLQRFGDDVFSRLDVAAQAERLSTPALVVHDLDDREVPFEEGRRLAAAWPGARLVATAGLGHRRILRDPVVLGEVSAFFADT